MATDYLERTILGKLEEVAPGDPANPEQAHLIAKAVRIAKSNPRPMTLGEIEAGAPLKQALSMKRAETFRKGQRLYVNDLLLTDAEIAFGDAPDQFREAFSAFCYAMHRGYGHRYIDRHQAESAEEFIDRPGKHTINLTALVIYVLSKLYHSAPAREIDVAFKQSQAAAAQALAETWGDPLFNLSMIEVDRLTRLLGTVSVRPFYDPARPGKIRLWVFLSHQLRVIPSTERPWEPAAVIERMQPFRSDAAKVIWTDRWFLTMRAHGTIDKVEAEPHTLGRIPHTFFKDSLSYTSFFADGRGRDLCTPNAHINNRLTDLHEIEQLQGFSMIEAINPESDDITVGPREAVIFRPPGGDQRPFGLNFKTPEAPLGELRASIDADVRDVLKVNKVPEAALGAAIQQRQLSGAAIRAAMAPIFEDNAERGRLFDPYEHDLADSCLRMRREHEPGFAYDHAAARPKFSIRWGKIEVPLDTKEQVEREAHDIANGIATPPEIMLQRWPDRFTDRDAAVLAWRANLAETTIAGFEIQDAEQAQVGAEQADVASLSAQLEAAAPMLDAMGAPAAPVAPGV